MVVFTVVLKVPPWFIQLKADPVVSPVTYTTVPLVAMRSLRMSPGEMAVFDQPSVPPRL
ncbi:MAG: hypothetical protein GFGODING_01264 [Flavobacteriales bacterium]|nr:hypothetical protein [Flavobacteriales bacterium]